MQKCPKRNVRRSAGFSAVCLFEQFSSTERYATSTSGEAWRADLPPAPDAAPYRPSHALRTLNDIAALDPIARSQASTTHHIYVPKLSKHTIRSMRQRFWSEFGSKEIARSLAAVNYLHFNDPHEVEARCVRAPTQVTQRH
ncbi:unnamed protein product, partial [Iphiclides podalirius]